MSGKGRQLKAGEYRFDRAMTPFEVIDKIARGDVYVIHVTFPEGLTIAEMAKIFESHGLGSAVVVRRRRRRIRRRFAISIRRRRISKAICFPETYALPRKTDAGEARAADGGRLQPRLHARAARRRPPRAT